MAANNIKSKINGALAQFVTTQQQPQAAAPTTNDKMAERKKRAAANAKYISPAPQYRAAINYAQPRTRRVQLIVRPDLFDQITAAAHAQGQSLNNLIETIIIEYLERSK